MRAAKVDNLPAAKYANVTLSGPGPIAVPPHKATLHALHAEAKAQRESELSGKQKIDQADRVLRKLEVRSKALQARIKALQKAKAAHETRYQRIEDAVICKMQAAGLSQVTGTRVSMALRNAPCALEILDEALVPTEYIREQLVTSIDKPAVKAALAKGVDVPGVGLTQGVLLVRQ